MKKEWGLADKDGNGVLSLKEVIRLLGKFNLKLKDKVVKATFKV